jgi:hypothetical protein
VLGLALAARGRRFKVFQERIEVDKGLLISCKKLFEILSPSSCRREGLGCNQIERNYVPKKYVMSLAEIVCRLPIVQSIFMLADRLIIESPCCEYQILRDLQFAENKPLIRVAL